MIRKKSRGKASLRENPVIKSLDSFKEIGADILKASEQRLNNAFRSPGDFLNFLTMGVPKGFADSYKERADKAFDSPYDFLNNSTWGLAGTVKGAFAPEEPFSKEHWLDSLGVAMVVYGGVKYKISGTTESTIENSTIEGTGKAAEAAGNKIKTNLGNEIDITPSSNHSTTTNNPGLKGTPNSSLDILDGNGNIKTRRWFGSDGTQTRDVDFTNHGNPKVHPEWPHEHGPR
jgi:hypothetical protein